MNLKDKIKDIDSDKNNGLMTKVWGPPGWLFFHCIAFGYPNTIDVMNPSDSEKKRFYKTFYNTIGKVFPCKYCRESYDKFILEIPIDNFLGNRRDLCYWTYLIHNKVNEKLGVAQCDIPTFEEVINTYEQFRAKCKKTSDKERNEKKEQGCIKPQNGKYKRCVMKVVTCNKDSINSNYILINKYLLFFSLVFIILYHLSHIKSVKKFFIVRVRQYFK